MNKPKQILELEKFYNIALKLVTGIVGLNIYDCFTSYLTTPRID